VPLHCLTCRFLVAARMFLRGFLFPFFQIFMPSPLCLVLFLFSDPLPPDARVISFQFFYVLLFLQKAPLVPVFSFRSWALPFDWAFFLDPHLSVLRSFLTVFWRPTLDLMFCFPMPFFGAIFFGFFPGFSSVLKVTPHRDSGCTSPKRSFFLTPFECCLEKFSYFAFYSSASCYHFLPGY